MCHLFLHDSVEPLRSDLGTTLAAFHGHCQFHDDFSRLQHEMRMCLNKRLNVTVFRMIEIVPVEGWEIPGLNGVF